MHSAHFVTKSHQAHNDNCKVSALGEEAKSIKNIKKAIDGGKEILVNLNMDVGMTSLLNFGPDNKSNLVGASYDLWSKTHNHCQLSVTNVADLVNIFNKISAIGGEAALDKVSIRYQKEIMDFRQFFIGDNEEATRQLVKEMYMQGEHNSNERNFYYGFPRLIKFKPTRKEFRSSMSGKKINGNSVFLNRRETTALILIQRVATKNNKMCTDLLDNVESYIVATPGIETNQLSNVFNHFQNQAKKSLYVKLNWPISSQEQYDAVPLKNQRNSTAQLQLF